MKAMRTVKEYVEISYFGERQIIPVYQYVCYASSYDMDARELHELYKQRSTSEFYDERDQYKTCFDWFILVPAKITRNGHQIEIKMYEHHFYKKAWEELDKLIEAA